MCFPFFMKLYRATLTHIMILKFTVGSCKQIYASKCTHFSVLVCTIEIECCDWFILYAVATKIPMQNCIFGLQALHSFSLLIIF